MKNTCVAVLFVLLSLLVLPSTMSGQTSPDPDPKYGERPYDSYHGGDIDTVSLGDGRLNVDIPLISYPQRGGKLTLAFRLHYENRGAYAFQLCLPLTGCSWDWVWHGGGFYLTDSQNAILTASSYTTNGTNPYEVGQVLQADGSGHTLVLVNGSHGETLDATGIQTSGGNIITPNGVRISETNVVGNRPTYSGSDRVADIYDESSAREDTNGNKITFSATGWVDTMGRAIPMPVATTDYTPCTGPLAITSALIWSLPGTPSGTFTVQICIVTVNQQIGYGTNATHLSVPQIQSVVLPNHTAWTFQYNSLGDLSQITYPTGGTIQYGWSHTGCREGGGAPQDNPMVLQRVINANDSNGSTAWFYNYTCSGPVQTVVTQPAVGAAPANEEVHNFTYLISPTYFASNLYENQALYYQGSHTTGTLLKTVNTDYSFYQIPYNTPDGLGNRAINVVPIRVTTIWPNGSQKKVEFDYDNFATFTHPDPLIGGTFPFTYGRRKAERYYDYGSGAPGPLLRSRSNYYMAFDSSSAASYMASNLIDLPYIVEDFGSALVAETQYNYDEGTRAASGLTSAYQFDTAPPAGNYRGNNTSVLRLLNTGTFTCPNGNSAGANSFIKSTNTYFDDGMLNTSADPCGNATTNSYSLTYWGALLTSSTNAKSQTTNYAYDFTSGLRTSITDPNNLTVGYSYDPMFRMSQASHPDGGNDTFTYQEFSLPFTSTLTSTINTTQKAIPLIVFDGIARTSEVQYTSDPQGAYYVDKTYDAVGRVASVSNPFRKGTDATSSPGSTTYVYDGLHRKTLETAPDGSAITTAYCGQWTLVQDPTGRWRRSRVDGLDRVVEVDEPNSTSATVASTGCPGTGEPIWVTSYVYSPLSDLTQVTQNGSRTRTFTYDSLSRMLTSNNPEVGAITYTYNPDGTVLTKKDARGITTCYGTWTSTTSTCTASTGYDALHRLLKVTYSNGDAGSTFTYDGTNCLSLTACQNIGHRTGMTDGAGSEAWAYQVDKTNNRDVHREQRTTSGITKTTTYYLDFAGHVTQIVYPTGRTINYTYDSANRPSTAKDGSNGITYATGWKTPPASTTCTASAACYTPQGAPYALSLGQTATFTGLNVLQTFNNRLQPSEIKASSTAGTPLDITYNFVDPVTGKNAGHVYGVTNNLNASRSQAFTYDQLNRILSAGTTATTGSYCWGYQYSYDAWGNLLSQAGWAAKYSACTESTMGSVTADASNHISGFSYDASGDTLGDGVYAYTWNAESQIKTAGGVTYNYDGDGRRSAKVGSKLYWYGSGGEILSETNTAGAVLNEYIYFGGKRVAVVPASGSALYYAEDMLGSSRVLVQATGTLCYDADFVPFGAERAYTSSCAQNYRFEGKERDTETLNDDFGAREYSWRFGRWLSSDWSSTPEPVPYASLNNPQTLNLYAMVADDPESFADLDGHGTGDKKPGVLGIEKERCASTHAEPCSDPPPDPPDPNTQSQANTVPITIPIPPVLPAVLDKIADVAATVSERVAAAVVNTTTAVVVGTIGYLASPNSGIQVCTCSTDQPQPGVTQKGPVKAADAPGVTAGGQATDKFGNKLGPSGERQVDKTRSNTREAARNKGLSEGSRVVEHKRDKNMGPHFHPADAKGEKKPSSTHHEYPD